jgi:S-DNA-T family DNA segregation ATPase FtsK/SpoIIIE
MQALKKGAVVYLADFKGGVDFPLHWHRLCRMCFDEHTLVDILTELLTELERRKQLFKSEDCPNIDEYNLKTGENLPRCLFACDEVSELLSRGITKEQKELTIKIEQMLASIARLGRAFGIHLILATQRPDATIISGQIKNNIDFRVCGRADNVLSQIVLDSTDAADLIPKDVSGRFLLQDGTLFQAYWFDDRLLF